MSRIPPKPSLRYATAAKHERLDPGAPMSHQVTAINKLRQQQCTIQIKSTPKKPGESLGIIVSTELVIEDFEAGESYYSKHFQLGDTFLKINGIDIPTRHQLLLMLSHFPEKTLTVVYSRRLYASSLPPERIRALAYDPNNGFGTFLITCSRLQGETPKDGFGFKVVIAAGKYYVADTDAGSPAERYFAVGDALLDVDGSVMNINNSNSIKKFSDALKTKTTFTCAVEFPITERSRRIITSILKTFFPTSDALMGEDAVQIGLEAARFHKMIFARMNPPSILRPPSMPNTVAKARLRPKVKTKILEKKKDEAVGAQRVVFNDKEKQKLVISSDVEDESELQVVEPRYSTEDEEEVKNPKKGGPGSSKAGKKKKNVFSFLSRALD